MFFIEFLIKSYKQDKKHNDFSDEDCYTIKTSFLEKYK